MGVDTLCATIQSYRQKINYCEAVGCAPTTDAEKESIELPDIFDDQGTCYATYDFLERFCDVRWYGPTELNTNSVPRNTLTIEKKERPPFAGPQTPPLHRQLELAHHAGPME